MKRSNDLKTIKGYINTLNLNQVFDPSVQSLLQLHYFETNDQIITESTSVKYLYLVIEGDSRVSPSSEDGKIVFLEFIYQNDVIGDLEYFSNDAYYHNVIALSPCTFLAIPVALIDTHFNRNINFYRFICENMATKMKRTSARYSRAMLYPLKNRLALFLLEESNRLSSDQLTIHISQIADYFGVTPRHLRRVFKVFSDEGLLTKDQSLITLTNKSQLQTYHMPLE